MTKAQILEEIRRTAAANGGVVLGWKRFEKETAVRYGDWFGVYWGRWGDAVREAGFEPNKLRGAFKKDYLLTKYAELALELGRIPFLGGDLQLKRRSDPTFPSHNTFSRFGTKAQLVTELLAFCRSNPAFDKVIQLCENSLNSSQTAHAPKSSPSDDTQIGYVYLIQHGSRREYKIGRTNNRLRREGEIGVELPREIEPIHVIETDDPAGIEAYWHHRFADKRLKNEWFQLTAKDVQAFKRWRRIC